MPLIIKIKIYNLLNQLIEIFLQSGPITILGFPLLSYKNVCKLPFLYLIIFSLVNDLSFTNVLLNCSSRFLKSSSSLNIYMLRG